MRVVHFTNNDFDGAGRAVQRLNFGLREIGVDSIMIVLLKHSIDSQIHVIGSGVSNRKRIEHIKKTITNLKFSLSNFLLLIPQLLKRLWQLRLRLYWKPRSLFNFNNSSVSFKKLRPYFNNADVICFHSVQDILTSSVIEKIYKETNAVLLFHPRDMEPMTGGCHFNFGCEKFSESCGCCPQLARDASHDFSYLNLQLKKRNYQGVKLHLIASNGYVKKRLQNSLFKNNPISIIYMGIEPERYNEIEKNKARNKINLLQDEKIILFGCFNASDKRKGAHLLKEALQNHFSPMSQNEFKKNNVRLVTFGMLNGFDFNDIPVKWTHLGQINNSKKMNLLYRSADVLVSPSTDDLGPTTIQEAFMNELPIISFKLGIAEDFIINGVNGFCIPCFDIEKLGDAIKTILSVKIDRAYLNYPKLLELRKQSTLEYEANAYMKIIKSEYHSHLNGRGN